MDPETGRLFIHGKEIVVAYYRAGFVEGDYSCEGDWEARIMLEKSRAIKCPNIDLHLTGCKTIQQLCGNAEFLARYGGEEGAAALSHVFKDLWCLANQDEETQEQLKKAIANPELYVLKPERDGGGNNLFGKELQEKLCSGEPTSQYLLMKRISPPEVDVPMLRNGRMKEVRAVSELGIFGAFIYDASQAASPLLENKSIGWILRTKNVEANESNIRLGTGVYDSPYLYELF